jgi:hypothetical protein
MIPASVTVSPSSGIGEASSNASSGGGSFYFGGNPTAAALLGKGGSTSWVTIAAVGVIGALLIALLLRK